MSANPNPIPDPFQDPKSLGYGRPVKALIYGLPGVGKTLFALRSMPEPIAVVDMEAGTNWYPDVADFKVMRTTSLDDIMNALRFLYRDNGQTYKTVVFDPVTVLWDVIKDGYFEAEGKIKEMGAGKIPFNAWSKIKPQMYQIYDILLNLPVHVVMVARAKDDLNISDGGKKVENVGLKPDVEKNLESILDMKILLFRDGDKRRAAIEKDRTGMLGKEGAIVTELGRKHFEPIFKAISNGPTAATPSIGAGVNALTKSAVEEATQATAKKIVQHPAAPKPMTDSQRETIQKWGDQLSGDTWGNGVEALRYAEFSRFMKRKVNDFKAIQSSEELNFDTAADFIHYLGTIAEQYFSFHNKGKETFADGWQEIGATLLKQVIPDGKRTTSQLTYVELKKLNDLLDAKIAEFEAAQSPPAQPKYVQHQSGLWVKFMEAGVKAFGSQKVWDENRHEFIFEHIGDPDRKSSTKLTAQEMGQLIAELGKIVMQTNNLDEEQDEELAPVTWDELGNYHRILLRKLDTDGEQHFSKLRVFGESYEQDLKTFDLTVSGSKSGYRAIAKTAMAILPDVPDSGTIQTQETLWDGFHILVFDADYGIKVSIRTDTHIKIVKSVASPQAFEDSHKNTMHYLKQGLLVGYKKARAGHYVAETVELASSSDAPIQSAFI